MSPELFQFSASTGEMFRIVVGFSQKLDDVTRPESKFRYIFRLRNAGKAPNGAKRIEGE